MQSQLELLLQQEAYAVDLVANAQEALARVQEQTYVAVVLDLGLPDNEGLEVLAALRECFAGPVLIVTARKTVPDRVQGLDAGADDYLTKPIAGEELLARLRAVIRRRQNAASAQSTQVRIELNPSEKTVRRGSHVARLTRREFSVFQVLAQHRGEVMSLPDLLEVVLEAEQEATPSLIHVAISRLRKKLGSDVIESVHGQGYVLR